MIAVYAESDGRVTLRHYKPEQLTQDRLNEATLQVETEPAVPDYDPETERADLYVVSGALEWQVTKL